MDRRQRFEDLTAIMQAILGGWQQGIWTALPGYIVSFDATKVTAQVQVTVQMKAHQPDGSWKPLNVPVLPDVPVVFPHGGGFNMTFPLAAGNEGLVVFATRCIDGWWQNGGIQPQVEFRMHDLSDGLFIPGPFSQPKVPSGGVKTDGVHVISDDGQTDLSLTPGKIKLVADEVEIAARNKFTFSGGGPGRVYQAGSIDTYETGVAVNPHAPPTPT